MHGGYGRAHRDIAVDRVQQDMMATFDAALDTTFRTWTDAFELAAHLLLDQHGLKSVQDVFPFFQSESKRFELQTSPLEATKLIDLVLVALNQRHLHSDRLCCLNWRHGRLRAGVV